jgi:very-short-patch-repair endonuclease
VKFKNQFTPHAPVLKICEAAAEQVKTRIIEEGFCFKSPAESPIEEVFGTAAFAWFEYISCRPFNTPAADLFDGVCARLAQQDPDPYNDEHVLATNQYQIDDMRVDFCFAGRNWRTGKVFRLVVECDGHDFHERTKEQAANDRGRDRALQERGYVVFRFTGAEIWRDPIACVSQVSDWLDSKSCEKP